MGQRADPDEVVRKHLLDAVDQVIGVLDPVAADELVAEVMAHPAGAGREQGEVGTPLALHLELTGLDALADLVVGDVHLAFGGRAHLGDLRTAVGVHAWRVGRVVAVDVDDHGCSC